MKYEARMTRYLSRAWGLALAVTVVVPSLQGGVEGWLHWRGPYQNGTSDEIDLPDKVQPGGENELWTFPIAGRGAPVIAGNRVYFMGYQGEGPDLREYLLCVDAASGKEIWRKGFNDYLSDTVYSRYSIGSPTIDPETGNIFYNTTCGDVGCVTPAGDIVWEYSLMERFGRLTFPNGRTGAPLVDGDVVIYHAITAYWGSDGPARDRFYAFSKKDGELVWSCTPGVAPQDSSFSSPVVTTYQGRRILLAGTGCGNVVCVDVRTGEAIWRYRISLGGVNSSVLLHDNQNVIAIHDSENVDSSESGRMVSIKIGNLPPNGLPEQLVLDRSSENWRNPLDMFTSSPVLKGDRIYQVTHTGVLACVDAKTGAILWEEKLDNSQLHASPLYADGKLYVPMASGLFYVLKLRDDGVDILDKVQLAGGCLGAPTVWGGRLYVHSMEKLYCFGRVGGRWQAAAASGADTIHETGKATRLRVTPSDVLLRPGQATNFRIDALDDWGNVVGSAENPQWEKFVPATARVRAQLDADFDDQGRLVAGPSAKPSAGSFRVTSGDLVGYMRGRLLPNIPFTEDFESYPLVVDHATEQGVKFAYPPLPWIGARFKWEVRDLDGNKVLYKTLDNVLFQRAITFFGHSDMSNYTMEADVMTDGNRRTMSNVGLINQRYVIALIGNWQQIEVSSNHDRIKVAEKFPWKAKSWYRLKTRVDVAPDGSGVVRAKAWPKGEAEPANWLIEVPHKHANTHGAPGIFGFSPQTRFTVYVDNVNVTPNP